MQCFKQLPRKNNLSETAYCVPLDTGFPIRWFTPATEVDLCGHATLSAAYVIFNIMGYEHDSIRLRSRSGELVVTRDKDLLIMNFPSQPVKACTAPRELVEGLNKKPVEVLTSEGIF